MSSKKLLKEYKLKSKRRLPKHINDNSGFSPFNKLLFKLQKQGLWQKFSPKMKKEFSKLSNWKIETKTFKKKTFKKKTFKKKTIKYFTFTKLKRYKASILGQEKLKHYKTIQGLNELVVKYNSLYNKYATDGRLLRENITMKQENELRKLKNTLLWAQLQNAKTTQRKETLKAQIKLFKENDYGVLFNTGTAPRINFMEFIYLSHPELLEKYRETLEQYTVRKDISDDEVFNIFKDDMINDLGLQLLKKGKDGYQIQAYVDDTNNCIVYLDI